MSAKSNERHKENEEMSEYGRPTPNVKVSVTRHFDASPERVFDAWLDPELIGKWMFGPALREEEVLRIVADARVGGSFSFLVRRQGQEIDHVGKYREIDRPRRLVFTWGIAGESEDESLVIIEIVQKAQRKEHKKHKPINGFLCAFCVPSFALFVFPRIILLT